MAVWTRANIGEVLPGIVTPLTFSVFQTGLTYGAAKIQRRNPEGEFSQHVRLIAGRAYVNLDSALSALAGLPAITPETLRQGLGFELPERCVAQSSLRKAASWARLVSETLLLAPVISSLLASYKREFSARGPPYASLKEGAQALQSMVNMSGECFYIHLRSTRLALSWFGLAALLSRRRGVGPAVTVRARKSTKGAAMYADLLGLASGCDGRRPYDSDPEPDLSGFILAHGNRPVQELELSQPLWEERPEVLGTVIESLRANRHSIRFPSQAAGERSLPLPLRVVELILERAVRLREETKQALLWSYAQLRRSIIWASKAMVSEGKLQGGDDVFYLTLQELVRLMEGDEDGIRDAVELRRGEYERNKLLWPPSLVTDFWAPASEPGPDRPSAATRVIKGMGCSPGVARGPARVVSDISEAESMRFGEVLVGSAFDPGWTPFLGLTKAIVTEIGGRLSHIATVAREIGLPAVMGAKDATKLIHTGQIVLVDGSAGSVTILGCEIGSPPSNAGCVPADTTGYLSKAHISSDKGAPA